MHCCVSGVALQFTEYALQSMTDEQKYVIDNLLLNMKVPKKLCRLSRSISDRKHWKSLEWENWLLYYSLPIFSIVMREDKLKHRALFVKSIHILLKTCIIYAEIENADAM